MASENTKKRKRGRCTHFNGIQHDECKAGVKYDDVRVEGQGLPCLRGEHCGRSGEHIPCEKRQWPTEAEIDEECREQDEQMQRSILAFAAVVEDAEKHGFKKGKGGSGKVDCPACGTGQLFYSVSSYNGHRRVRCTTDKCVHIVE